MTGKELLINELSKSYHRSKIKANMSLIEDVVKILTENPDEKIALDIANRKDYDAENKLDEVRRIKAQIDTCARALDEKESAVNDWAEDLEDQRKTLEKRGEQLQKCDTPEAADKLRLAFIYMDNVKGMVTNGYERTAFIKGLAQVMGTEGYEE